MSKTDKKIALEKYVARAEKAGWDFFDWKDADDFDWHIGEDENGRLCLEIEGLGDEYYWSPEVFLFNHSFAKAVWGEDWAYFTEGISGDTIGGNFKNYLGHLANMVVSEDILKYLEKNL